MDNAKKHYIKLQKQMTMRLGKEKTDEILKGLDYMTGNEPPEEIGKWAAEITNRLETNIEEKDLITIREECACIKTNKYSAYNKKYFKELREKYHDDETTYLKAIADFLNGKGRCGKKVEFIDGKIMSHFGFGNSCVCHVIKGGWKMPPSTTWCRCCQGTLKSIYQFAFENKICHMDIVETFATGGKDCVFVTWYSDK